MSKPGLYRWARHAGGGVLLCIALLLCPSGARGGCTNHPNPLAPLPGEGLSTGGLFLEVEDHPAADPAPAGFPVRVPCSGPGCSGQPAPAPAPREQPLLEAQPLTFAWPVKGKVVAGFAEPRQKGIDIQGKSGDAVIAAAAGRVTYVGSGIPGLGKLIVLKHDQGYITVYAHNKDLLVKEQQTVKRGEKIAELGEKLHFQIRKGAAAVDPLLYLPRS